jgi:hypothetical protein
MSAHVFAVHVDMPPSPVVDPLPQWLGTPPPPHVSGEVQVPQSTRPPQPSPCMPHVASSSAQVFLVHGPVPVPQTLGPPPPQISPGTVHVPQSTRPPHPSATGPQFFPRSVHVFGVHVGPVSSMKFVSLLSESPPPVASSTPVSSPPRFSEPSPPPHAVITDDKKNTALNRTNERIHHPPPKANPGGSLPASEVPGALIPRKRGK